MPDYQCPHCNSLDVEIRRYFYLCNECRKPFDPYTTEHRDYQFRAAARRWLELAGKEGRTARESRAMCPHCGWTYPSCIAYDNDGVGLVPVHSDASTNYRCDGSEQAPRNPESDRRPLWKDGGVK